MANAIIIIGSALMVAACIGAAVSMGGQAKEGRKVSTSNRSIQSICKPTNYKDQCVNSLNEAAPNTTDPKQLVKVGFQVARKSLVEAIGKSATIKAAQSDPRGAQALEICREVMEYAANHLEKCVDSAGKFDNAGDLNQFMEDLKVWIGSAITYQDVCFDAFQNCTNLDAAQKLRSFFNVSRQLTSNALAMMDEAKQFITLDLPGLNGSNPARRLLLQAADSGDQSVPIAGTLPAWLNDAQRKLLDQPVPGIKATAVVAQDGSGQFKTIGEALATNPNVTDKPFIVHVKAGIYKEYLTIGKTQCNVVLIGDGPTVTIITGDKNFVDGIPVYKTATVGVLGDGFMARDIGFENTAGAAKHEAVAMRVAGDYAVFVNCQFDGFQSTLFSVLGRHFYRDCTAKGTLDILFGDAQAVFQNSNILIKKPLDHGDKCTVAAQGRTEAGGPGAIILQNCSINAEPALLAAKGTGGKAYLGRPNKEFSRIIVMQSSVDASIDPEGWAEWAGKFGTETCFFAEYQNRGPGADMAKRVTWKGVKKLNAEEVQQFTPEAFFKGSIWVSPTGAPYLPGMITI